jgi:L-aspartate oxidase
VPVTVVTRAREPRESNTFYAQGGIIYQGENDSPSLLVEDVLRAGAGRCDADSVTILAEQGPELVYEVLLQRIGVAFDRTGSGSLSLAREGGHTLPRIIHAADATGKAITIALLKVLQRHSQVTLLTGHTALDLLRDEQGNCVGASLLDQDSGQIVGYTAQQTILATGGLGQIYKRSTNPAGARGDGIAMAARAGARLVNLEFVQFHPTTFAHPEGNAFLISEAVRGAGARLVDAAGEPFMQRYAPEWGDLAPRDVVSRSIQQEMARLGVPHVYLDLRAYIDRAEILSHFPTIYETCLRFGIDITRDLVPVAPAAHYSCGGVWVDAWGQTSLSRLYAAGEVACTGLHGANRLASTSLLEGVVWGDRAARHVAGQLIADHPRPNITMFPASSDLPQPVVEQLERMLAHVQDLMWQQVGVVRTTLGLEAAVATLQQLQTDVETYYQRHTPTDASLGLRNAVQTALLVTQAALQNPVGVGCHYRV